MKIAILSDSHDNIPNIEKALKFIRANKIKIIIHCGDLAAPSILSKVIMPNFQGEIHLVHGNVGDPELLEKMAKDFKNVKVYGTEGKLEIDGKQIAFTHFPETAKKLAKTAKFDYVFYGHTHRPWIEELKAKNEKVKTFLVNSGTLAGMFYKATFAILDTKTNKLELKILEKI